MNCTKYGAGAALSKRAACASSGVGSFVQNARQSTAPAPSATRLTCVRHMGLRTSAYPSFRRFSIQSMKNRGMSVRRDALMITRSLLRETACSPNIP